MAQNGETRIYVLKAELKMDASETERMKTLGADVATCSMGYMG